MYWRTKQTVGCNGKGSAIAISPGAELHRSKGKPRTPQKRSIKIPQAAISQQTISGNGIQASGQEADNSKAILTRRDTKWKWRRQSGWVQTRKQSGWELSPPPRGWQTCYRTKDTPEEESNQEKDKRLNEWKSEQH